MSAELINGIVIDSETNKTLIGATIGVFQTQEIVTTDDNGRFKLNLERGKMYRIIVTYPGYSKKEVQLDITGRIELIKVFLTQNPASGEEIVVTAKKEKSRVSRQTIKNNELKMVPGTAGDIMRTMQSLPGIATGSDISGELFVRGSGSYENRILLDRFWLIRAYHFGGFVSVVNSDLIDTIDFYTGGFPVIYGEATGSILEINTRKKEEPTWGGKVNINLLTADFLVEAPFTEKGYVILSGRRSYFDLYAEKFIQEALDVDIAIMPYFWDYQGKLGYFFNKKNSIEFLFYGTGDRISLYLRENEDMDFAGRNLDFAVQSHGQGFTWKLVSPKKFNSTLKAGLYQESSTMIFGEYIDIDTMINAALLREDITLNLSKYIDIDLGIYYEYALLDFYGKIPVIKGDIPNPVFPEDYNMEDLMIKDLYYHHYANYIQQTLTLPPFKWTAGLRYDLHNDVTSFQYWSPRTSLEFSINKNNRLYTAAGLYQQVQNLYFRNKDYGNEDLTTQKAIHYITGYALDITPTTTFTAEGYYKDLYHLVVTGVNGKTFDDTGTGKIYGGEIYIRKKLDKGFFGWLSYGYSQSKRNDHGGEKGEYYFNYDRTHMINLITSYKPVNWFQAGIKWRYATGLPYTEITGSKEVIKDGRIEHHPVYSPDYNGKRLEVYHKLDVRIDFFTNWFGVTWDLYIEVWNVYNNENIYKKEFNQKEPYSAENPKSIRDLPLLPFAGVEVKF